MIGAPRRRRLPYTRTVCASPSRTIGEWNEGKQGNGADGTDGAGCRTRPADLPLTRRVLYLLSLTGAGGILSGKCRPEFAGGCYLIRLSTGRVPPGAGGGGGGRGVSPPSSSPAPLPPSVTTNWTTRPAGEAGSGAGVAVSATATETAEGMSEGGGGKMGRKGGAGGGGWAAGFAVSDAGTERAEGMPDGGGGNAMPWPFSRA